MPVLFVGYEVAEESIAEVAFAAQAPAPPFGLPGSYGIAR